MSQRHTTPLVMTVPAALLVIGAVVLGLSGCGGDKNSEPWKDAGRTSQDNNGKAQVVTMPDGFNNAATKCLGDGLRVTTTFHGNDTYAAVSVVPDPLCTAVIPQH